MQRYQGFTSSLLLALAIVWCTEPLPAAGQDFSFGIELYEEFQMYTEATPKSARTFSVVNPADGSTTLVTAKKHAALHDLMNGLRFYFAEGEPVSPYFLRIGNEPFFLKWRLNFDGAGTDKGRNGNYILASEDWRRPSGRWPKAGLAMRILKYNLLFIEKPLYIGTASDLSFVAKLDYHQIKWYAFATRYPYGDQWYDALENSMNLKRSLVKESLFLLRAGPRFRFTVDDFEISFDALYGIPIDRGHLVPTLSIGGSIGYRW